ncbi:FliH/SctL family protein [Azospirillum thermophilum]|uniref:FliH protein n=1 Tax=Azospirillum thermophilum TaxID=2202148 RepID=A0A2S2CUR7_9PROT|nr:FliH/SctL family protein [Azospirillum thermophilum]AWK88264.1 fliH protein [Azospirillum thermophilum]
MGYPRYRFDQRFDSTAQAAAAAAAIEPAAEEIDPLDVPVHSERFLQATLAAKEMLAYSDGVEQGRREGEAAAADRIEATLVEALQRLDERLGSLDDRFVEVLQEVEAHGSAILVALVRRLAPRLLEQVGRAEVERLAGEALRLAGGAPVLRLTVHPEMEEAVRARVAASASVTGGFAGTVRIDDDPALPPGTIDAAWDTGGLRYDPAAVETAVAGLCDRALAALTDIPAYTDREDPESCPR